MACAGLITSVKAKIGCYLFGIGATFATGEILRRNSDQVIDFWEKNVSNRMTEKHSIETQRALGYFSAGCFEVGAVCLSAAAIPGVGIKKSHFQTSNCCRLFTRGALINGPFLICSGLFAAFGYKVVQEVNKDYEFGKRQLAIREEQMKHEEQLKK